MEQTPGLHRMLGELSADMKHVLHSLEANRAETTKLRDETRGDNEELNRRISKIERFRTRVIAYSSVGIPLGLAALKWLAPLVFKL